MTLPSPPATRVTRSKGAKRSLLHPLAGNDDVESSYLTKWAKCGNALSRPQLEEVERATPSTSPRANVYLHDVMLGFNQVQQSERQIKHRLLVVHDGA